ncbi:MAG: hypothetical protein AAB758_03180 [Patescibacteria group bacterium]
MYIGTSVGVGEGSGVGVGSAVGVGRGVSLGKTSVDTGSVLNGVGLRVGSASDVQADANREKVARPRAAFLALLGSTSGLPSFCSLSFI